MKMRGRNKQLLALTALLIFGGTMFAQDYFDDVYYNPKKDKSVEKAKIPDEVTTVGRSVPSTQTNSTYIANMADMDVDAYNRRGEQYYVTSIDTIGSVVENGEDFVYTQQIQKYYNPTIVVDNANALGDVLSNAYGNVDIVINNNGYPVFAPYYGWNWPYYSYSWSPWSWGVNIGPWGWSVGWYDPWYAWSPGWWGPSWSWGPSWGWGPSWRPGPGWHPGPSWRPGPWQMATWNPRGNRPAAPRPGWSHNTQPGGNLAHRPAGGNYRAPGNGGNAKPGGAPMSSRPAGVVNNNGHWQYNNSNAAHRTESTIVSPGNVNPTPNKTPNRVSSANKVTESKVPTTTTSNRTTVTNNKNNSNSNSSNRSNNTVNNHRTTTSNSNNSFSTGRSSMGGARSSGGASRSSGGAARSGGGGGGRHR